MTPSGGAISEARPCGQRRTKNSGVGVDVERAIRDVATGERLEAAFARVLGKGIIPQAGGAEGRLVSIQIWNKLVSSSSKLNSECVTPVPALMTWTSPAPVRPLLPNESWCVIAPLRT